MSEAIRDLERDGAPVEVIAQLRVDDDFEVWPENRRAVNAFLSVSTQWRLIARPDGGAYWQGLDYAGVAAGLHGAGIEATPPLWADLRIMETAARDRLNGIEVAG